MGYGIKTTLFLLLFLFLAPPSVFADSILNDLMPSVFGPRDHGPKPEETLIAPFAQDEVSSRKVQPAEGAALSKPENLTPLTVAHRDRAFMLQWAASQAAGAMTYNPVDISEKSPDRPDAQESLFKKAFLPTAQADVQALFQTPYFANRLGGKNLQIKGFVENPGTIQNEGVFGDAYRWLIDVPVTITFFPQGNPNYNAGNAAGFETVTVMIRLQIARVSGEYPDGCAIERFTTSTPLP